MRVDGTDLRSPTGKRQGGVNLTVLFSTSQHWVICLLCSLQKALAFNGSGDNGPLRAIPPSVALGKWGKHKGAVSWLLVVLTSTARFIADRALLSALVSTTGCRHSALKAHHHAPFPPARPNAPCPFECTRS